jgi:two-component sensor histidine kinase
VAAERPDGSRIPFLAYPTPLRDASGALVGAINMLVDITERKAAEKTLREREARLQLLAREMDHRAKNMLATVRAIARMTRADTVPAFVCALLGRLDALSRAHALLAESRWIGADLKRLVEDELAAYCTGDGGRVTISGPGLALRPEAAQVLAMALHELATNAAKYGALSAPDGRVAVEWSWESDERLVLRWTETGGPPIRRPSHRGFGSSMIEGAVNGQLDGAVHLDWPAEGLACRMTIPRQTLVDGTRG